MDIQEIFYFIPVVETRIKYKKSKKWILLEYTASIHRDNHLMITNDDYYYAKPIDELDSWLNQRPHSISYTGDRLLISLTEKDMALLKVFWG